MRLLDFVEAILHASEETAVNTMQKFAESRGINFFVHTFMSSISSDTVARGAEDWQDIYFSEDFFNIDPVVAASTRAATTFTWDNPGFQVGLDKDQQGFMHEAAKHGLANGISIPIPPLEGGKGLTSFATEENRTFSASERHDFQIAAMHFHMRRTPKQAPEAFELSNRIVECLNWAAAGKTEWETAQILGIHEASIKEYLKRARAALNANNKVEAVAKAIRYGIVRL